MTNEEISAGYEEWCQRIAEHHTPETLIEHFREHVWEHFTRHSREGKLSMDVWMIGVFNFANIFQRMFPHVTTADLLFKLGRYYVNHESNAGPPPPFDLEEFFRGYEGPILDFHLTRAPAEA